MADLGLIKLKYKSLLKKLLPQGFVWHAEAGTDFDRLLDSCSLEPARVEARAMSFLSELYPLETFEMLDNWERLLQIPDECTPEDYSPSISERRLRILQKLTTGGGQSKAFYKTIARQLGYDVSAFDVENYSDFRAGRARAGDAISNSANPDGSLNPSGWSHAFQIKAPADNVRRFSAGKSAAGEPLTLIQNTTLECVIRKFAPAHAVVTFSYTE